MHSTLPPNTPAPDTSTPTAPSEGKERPSLLVRLRNLVLSDYFILWLSIAYFLVLAPFLPTLTNPANLSNLLSNTWPLLAVAVGQTFVLTIAGIDLSQGAVIGFTSTVMAVLVATSGSANVLEGAPVWGLFIDENGGLFHGLTFSVFLSLMVMLAVGTCVGALNGLAIAYLRMPPFMMTLVTMIVVSAFAVWLTQSENIGNLPESLVTLGKGDIISVYFGEQDRSQIPRREIFSVIGFSAVIAISLAVAAHILLNKTVFGRQVIAIGANRKAAEISGVPVKRIIVMVFAISAFCATVGSILYSARLEAGRPTLGEGTFLLDVIGATVIGGTSLFGGKGKIIWTVFGVIFFVLLSNTLNLMNLSTFHIDMAKGGVILCAALLDVARNRYSAERGL
jgi:ribose/xylose/arabinose/galactoside ABC-type transport system permease subunit